MKKTLQYQKNTEETPRGTEKKLSDPEVCTESTDDTLSDLRSALGVLRKP